MGSVLSQAPSIGAQQQPQQRHHQQQPPQPLAGLSSVQCKSMNRSAIPTSHANFGQMRSDEYFDALLKLIARPSFKDHCMKAMSSPRRLASAIDAASSDDDLSSGFESSSENSEDDDRDSFTTQQYCSQQKYGLADAFYDCLTVTLRNFGNSVNEHVPFTVLVKEMEGFVPRSEDTWDEWDSEQKLEACVSFALAFEYINVMTLDAEQKHVRFHTSHEPNVPFSSGRHHN